MTDGLKELKNGRYRLVRVLGEGSQGETYEAVDRGAPTSAASDAPLTAKWDRYVERARAGEDRGSRRAALEPTERLVAVKCFRVGKAKAWKDVELAEREARILKSLDHPRLPRYIDHFEEDGALYLVMEKVEGESLASMRKAGRFLGVEDIARMIEDISDALRYLHGRSPSVVHRDIKPANVIRRPDGSFALVDFGAVRDRLKPAGGSTVVGTFGYMAPEQFQGRASPRSDVYGLGATAIAMLTGREPEELPHEGLGIDVPRALPRGTPAPLVRALTAMLVADPDRRAGSAEEVLALLGRGGSRRSKRPAPTHRRSAAPTTKKQKREERNRKRREARAERARRRALARGRRPPFVPRLFAKLGLVIAMLAVWLAVGVAVPILLGLLSLVFGPALRRAAGACRRAAGRAQSRLNDAWGWLSGERAEDALPPRVRVAAGQTETETEEAGNARVAVAGYEDAVDEGDYDERDYEERDYEESAYYEDGEPPLRRRARD